MTRQAMQPHHIILEGLKQSRILVLAYENGPPMPLGESFDFWAASIMLFLCSFMNCLGINQVHLTSVHVCIWHYIAMTSILMGCWQQTVCVWCWCEAVCLTVHLVCHIYLQGCISFFFPLFFSLFFSPQWCACCSFYLAKAFLNVMRFFLVIVPMLPLLPFCPAFCYSL